MKEKHYKVEILILSLRLAFYVHFPSKKVNEIHFQYLNTEYLFLRKLIRWNYLRENNVNDTIKPIFAVYTITQGII